MPLRYGELHFPSSRNREDTDDGTGQPSHPILIAQIPPVFDGPTVFNSTATYYDRALAYIAAGDECVSTTRSSFPPFLLLTVRSF